MARSVSRSRARPPAEKRMRMESTARSRSRSMSKPPRDEMGVKDVTVSFFHLQILCWGLLRLLRVITTILLLYASADEEQAFKDWSKGPEEGNREALSKRRRRSAHFQPQTKTSVYWKTRNWKDRSSLNHCILISFAALFTLF